MLQSINPHAIHQERGYGGELHVSPARWDPLSLHQHAEWPLDPAASHHLWRSGSGWRPTHPPPAGDSRQETAGDDQRRGDFWTEQTAGETPRGNMTSSLSMTFQSFQFNVQRLIWMFLFTFHKKYFPHFTNKINDEYYQLSSRLNINYSS